MGRAGSAGVAGAPSAHGGRPAPKLPDAGLVSRRHTGSEADIPADGRPGCPRRPHRSPPV